jgi:hypothetical protein
MEPRAAGDEPERALFRRLGAFVGGATLDAVEAVCAAGASESDELLDRLGSLVDKSLVDREVVAGEPRFTMLGTIREYALEQLEASGEAAVVRRAHLRYVVALAEAAEPQVFGGPAPPPDQRAWLDRLERERDDLRAAYTHALAEREMGLGLRLVGALYSFWLFRGSRTEGRAIAAAMLALPHDPAAVGSTVSALGVAGCLAWVQGELAMARLHLGAAMALPGPDDRPTAQAHNAQILAMVAYAEGAYAESRRLLDESMPTVRELGSTSEIAFWTYWLGVVAGALGDLPGSRGLIEESLALFKEVGDDWGMALTHMELAQ